MRNLWLNSLIIVVLAAIAVVAVTPPQEKIRLGKDLAGGVSLTYSVDIKPGDVDTMPRVVEVIKERLDPNGVLEISVVAVGADRIEITMPLPTAKVKGLREEFEKTLAAFGGVELSADEANRAMRMEAQRRDAELARLAGDDRARLDALRRAAGIFDELATERPLLDEALRAVEQIRTLIDADLAAGGSPDSPQVLEWQAAMMRAQQAVSVQIDKVAPLELEYEAERDAALAGGLTAAEVRRALSLSNRAERMKSETGRIIELPSPRKVALDAIREKHTDAKTIAALENSIAKWNEYEANRRTLDDPSDLIRMLRGAGVLDFRITVAPGEYPNELEARNRLRLGGPAAYRSGDAKWYKINKIRGWVQNAEDLERLADPETAAAFFAERQFIAEKFRGEFYLLCWDRRGLRLTSEEGDWAIRNAYQGQDNFGRPAIDFRMDALGAAKLGDLTGKNIGRSMAVLLDDEVYTAPRLNGRISDSGQIYGTFSNEELQYVIRVLSAGALAQRLSQEPISQVTLGPQLGADNLQRGLRAGVISLIVTAGFMVVYYFGCGMVAVIALLLNSLLLMGAMALNHAAFTLPGIAGVILTFGMAVDANVLVYERMREEFQRGEDLRTAVRLGYEKALSAIVDGNLTTLIVCVVLGFTGTPEIKGFALTLGIGLVTTLFSQLFFTRLLFTVLVEKVRIRRLSMLPLAVPIVQRAFSLKIDWLKFRGLWYAVSFFFVGLGVLFIAVEGRDLLASEFRGGTAVTIQTRKGEDGQGIRLTRAEVAERIKRIAADAPAGSPLVELTHAEVSVVNPDPGGVRSDTFTIKSLLTNAELMQSSVSAAFADVLDARPPLVFKGSGAAANRGAPVFPVVSVSLGESLDRPSITERVDREFLGALAVLLEDIHPAVSRREIEDRITQARTKTEFAEAAGRAVRVLVIEGTDESVRTAVVLVQDRGLSHFDDEPRWNENVRDREWALIQTALTETQTLASVQNFGSSIAATFRANAITAVLISGLLVVVYIWVRFGSFRYSAAAIATTTHDCFVAIGMVGAAAWVYHEYPDVAAKLMILPFKIDLNVIAAILTILGYSLNDTIVVMDRIRENRGKLPYASREVINASVNQTLSRTIITGGTTFISCIVLYLIGGEGVRVFAYTMIIGIVVGTFSSIAVAAPLVWSSKADPHENDSADRLTT